MARGIQVWSKTAASNATADSGVNWAEGMAPSAINDSARAEMASAAMWRDDNNGSLAGTLSTATYSVTSNQTAAGLTAGYTVAFQIDTDMPATALLNLDTLGGKPLRPYAGTDFVGGEYKANSILRATYATSNSGEWIVRGFRRLGSSADEVVTANITAKAVTYAKIQDVADQRLLGNVSGGAAAPEEITIGQGLVVSGTTLTAPAFPPSSSFKNLSIKVASNTTVTVAADFVVTTNGTTYQTTALSGTINLGTNGAANALDTGTIAIDTWYAIWAIAKADGTTAALASTSATTPTMPTGYTYKARVGWVRTIHATATLYGTWQLGRRAQYIVGLAQTTRMPQAAVGIAGTPGTGTYVAVPLGAFVPSTASAVVFSAANVAGRTIVVAPNNSYGGYGSTTNPPPFMIASNAGAFGVLFGQMLLESTSIYWASDDSTQQMSLLGWEDNI